MTILSHPAGPATTRPLHLASDLRRRFTDPDAGVLAAMAVSYGDDPETLRRRAGAAVQALDRFLEAYGDRPCALYRAPGRLSLNPHADHQGAWVPYGLHIRELLSVVAFSDDDCTEIVNVDPTFTERLAFSAGEEIRRAPDAWGAGWVPYIEAGAVVEEVRRNVDAKGQPRDRRATLNYVKAAALRLRHATGQELPGLRMALHGDITQGGGQSSSSAIVVTTALALSDAAAPRDRRDLAALCGEAEWYVGTRGGSGDHSAMLFGSRGRLAHLCFEAPVAVRGVRYSPFPAGYQLIVANSQTRAEKSAEERLLFNRGIFAYRFAFLALKEAMAELGLPAAVIEETRSLGDLHTGRLAEADLYRLVLSLPEWITPAELARRFPDRFAAAARGCFGTADPALLPAEIPLRGAAVFGLGRVDRGLVMPDLLEDGSPAVMEEFGRLMSVTHDGDRLFTRGRAYTESRERLSDSYLLASLRSIEADESRPLRSEPGFYGASIAELDEIVDIALRQDGVLGAGLMGAGGGGYVLVLAREGVLPALREALTRDYYRPQGKEPDVEAWHTTAAAGRLL